MVHFDCDPIAQAAVSPHSSSPSAGSEDAALSQATSYACPSCRGQDSSTPSEVSAFSSFNLILMAKLCIALILDIHSSNLFRFIRVKLTVLCHTLVWSTLP